MSQLSNESKILNVLEQLKEQMTDQEYIDAMNELRDLRAKDYHNYKIRFCVIGSRMLPSDDTDNAFLLTGTQHFAYQVFSLTQGAYQQIANRLNDNYDCITNLHSWTDEYPELQKVQDYLDEISHRLEESRRIFNRYEECDGHCQNIDHYTTHINYEIIRTGMIIDINPVSQENDESTDSLPQLSPQPID